MPISPSPLTRQSVLVASYSIYVINRYAAPSILWNKHCLPLRTVDMTCSRHMPSSLWSIVRGTGHLTRPLHSLGGCIVVWFLVCSILRCCSTWYFISNVLATSLPIRSWQKGDRPDNGDVEPCSNQPKKKTSQRFFSLSFEMDCSATVIHFIELRVTVLRTYHAQWLKTRRVKDEMWEQPEWAASPCLCQSQCCWILPVSHACSCACMKAFCDTFLTRKPGVRPQRAVFSSCLAVWKQMNGLILARRKRHMWSMPCKWSLTLSLLTSLQSSSCRERRRLNKARHIWEELRINWRLLRHRLLTKHLTVLRWNDLYNRLFLNIYEERMKWKEDKCSGPHENTVSFIGPERRDGFFRVRQLPFPPLWGFSFTSRSWTTWMLQLGVG